MTERIFVEGKGHHRKGWSQNSAIALRKLNMLQAAASLTDLGSPPGNRLEALSGDLEGYHSIRINEQWRIIFAWTSDGPDQVQIS